MKLPKLPVECIRRALGSSRTYIPWLGRELSSETVLAGFLFGEFDTDIYTAEELLKLNVLKPIMEGVAYVYVKSGLDEELIQFFDSIKDSLPSVIYFVRGIRIADDRPLDKSKVKQHILDTLIGTAWRDSNFYIWGRPEPPHYGASSSTLSYDIKEMITTDFEAKYNRDLSIERLLSKGLCIFDKLPEDRLVKFFDALRRLMPYIRYLHMPTKYRQHHQFLVDDKHTGNLYTYNVVDFPITLSAKDVVLYSDGMQARWAIKGKKLVIDKTFHVQLCAWGEDEIMKQFYDKYPEQARDSRIEKDHRTSHIKWEKTESYELPKDLQELGKIWRELL